MGRNNLAYSSGELLLLTKRKFKLLKPKTWISGIIERVQGEYTHSAVIYEELGNLWVRDMEADGNHNTLLSDYLNKYKDRIHAFSPLFEIDEDLLWIACNKANKYDNISLLCHLIKWLTGEYLCKSTNEKRTCFEDTAVIYNMSNKKCKVLFHTPQEVTHNDFISSNLFTIHK